MPVYLSCIPHAILGLFSRIWSLYYTQESVKIMSSIIIYLFSLPSEFACRLSLL
jgi:hypothetical protein